MLFLMDISQLAHAYFYAKKNDDVYDVTERVTHRLERLRLLFTDKFPGCVFVSVFDNTKETFRHMLYPAYKANRNKDDALVEIMATLWEAVSNDADWIALEAPLLLEADDLIASLAAQYSGKVIIHSNDKDMHQCLVDGRVTILKGTKVNEQTRDLNWTSMSTEKFRSEYGFEPEQWIDYQCIAGDSSDNIQDLSWKWAGDKLAKQIVQSGDNIRKLSPDDPRLDKRQSATLHNFQTNYLLIRKLVTLRTDIRWPCELKGLT